MFNQAEYMKQYRIKHKKHLQELNRSYYLRDKSSRLKHSSEYYQKYLKGNRMDRSDYIKSISKSLSEWTTHFTDPKFRARVLLQRAIRKGKIVKPKTCSSCNKHKSIRELHGHHIDYSKWWDIIWLCSQCHKDKHVFIRKVGEK